MEEVHLLILFITVVFIAWADHEAFAYVRGKKLLLNGVLMTWLHRAVLVGLVGMIATGAYMVLPAWSFYSADILFLTKMGFVAVLIINSFFIGNLMELAITKPFTELSVTERAQLMLSGGASVVGWLGAFIIGMFFL